MDLSFETSAEDSALIDQIVTRGRALDRKHHVRGYSILHCTMDITAAHANGTPLRLADMLAADDFNFAHDWSGIRRHLNRETGQMLSCFLPRFHAARDHAEAA